MRIRKTKIALDNVTVVNAVSESNAPHNRTKLIIAMLVIVVIAGIGGWQIWRLHTRHKTKPASTTVTFPEPQATRVFQVQPNSAKSVTE